MPEDVGIGAKVSLDMSQFGGSISKINEGMQLIQAQFKEASSRLGNFASDSDKLSLKQQELSEKIEQQRQKVNLLNDAYQKSATETGQNSDESVRLAKSLLNAQSALNKMQNDLEKTNLELKNQPSSWSKLRESIENTEKSTSKIQGIFSGLKSSLLGFFAGLGTSVSVGSIIDMAEEGEAPLSQLDSVLKSTGQSAGVTKSSVLELADSLSKQTTFENDAVISSQNMLLTFTNIGKNVFPQATKTVLDMSQALGQDTKSSAIQLGKALNDPLTGITALQRVGVTFTQSQKDQIKSMVDANNVAGAQTLILKELQKEFGGSAQAAGQNFSGQLKIAKNSIHDAGEEISVALVPIITSVMPKLTDAVKGIASEIMAHKADIQDVVTKISDAVTGIFNFVTSHGEAVKALIAGIGTAFALWKAASVIITVIDALKKMQEATKAASLAQAALNLVMSANPIGLIVIAIGVLVAGFVYLWNTCKPFRDFWIGLWDGIKTVTKTVVDAVVGFFKSIPDKFHEVVNAVVNFAKQWGPLILTAVAPLIGLPLLIIQHWGEIEGFFKGLWDKITGFFGGIGDWFGKRFSEAQNAIKTFFQPDAISSHMKGAWDKVQGAFSNVKGWFGNTFENAKQSILEHFSPTAIMDHMNSVWDKIKESLAKLNPFNWGKDMIDGMIKGIRSGIDGMGDAAKSVADKIKNFLHFSTPDEGPLAEYEKWMPDFIEGMSRGIENSKYKLINAIRLMSANMTLGVKGATSQPAGNVTNNYGGTLTIPVYVDGKKVQTITLTSEQLKAMEMQRTSFKGETA